MNFEFREIVSMTTQIKAIKKIATSIVEGHAKKHPSSIKDLDDYGKLVDMYKEDMDLNGSTSFRRFIHQEVQNLIKLKRLTSAQNAKLFAHLLSSSDS